MRFVLADAFCLLAAPIPKIPKVIMTSCIARGTLEGN